MWQWNSAIASIQKKIDAATARDEVRIVLSYIHGTPMDRLSTLTSYSSQALKKEAEKGCAKAQHALAAAKTKAPFHWRKPALNTTDPQTQRGTPWGF